MRSSTKRPLIVKLSPNVTSIAQMAKVAASAGADALSLVNTFFAMSIDVEARKPRLSNITGGLSGPAIKPIAVRMVYEAARAVSIRPAGIFTDANVRTHELFAPDPASALLAAMAFAAAAWVTGSMVSGLFRLARLSDQDRGLLRAPFDGMANKTAIQYFCGLPPIIRFVRGAKAKLFILASSVLFSLAFTQSPMLLIEVGNRANPVTQLAILAGAVCLIAAVASYGNSFTKDWPTR